MARTRPKSRSRGTSDGTKEELGGREEELGGTKEELGGREGGGEGQRVMESVVESERVIERDRGMEGELVRGLRVTIGVHLRESVRKK